MKLTGQQVVVFLSDDGVRVLEQASVDFSDGASISVFVEEAEELGLWIRVPRDGQLHLFLLQWGYIVGIDLPVAGGKLIGLRG
jgi:hypothetical protein